MTFIIWYEACGICSTYYAIISVYIIEYLKIFLLHENPQSIEFEYKNIQKKKYFFLKHWFKFPTSQLHFLIISNKFGPSLIPVSNT